MAKLTKEQDAFGRARQGPLDQAGRDAHPVAIEGAAVRVQQLPGRVVLDDDPGAFEDLEAGEVEVLDLLVGEDAELDAEPTIR